MSQTLAKLIDIRPEESGQVARMTAILFCVIGGHTLMETARDALFLAELEPKSLTLVYVALSGLVVVAARLGTELVTRFGKRSALIFTLVVTAYGTTTFYLLPKGEVAVFALYLWSGLVGSVAVVQFWLLAGHVFTVGQGKRLFGPLAAGGVLGAVGGATSAIVMLRYLETELLLVFAVVFFLAGALVLTTLQVEEPAQPYLESRRHPLKDSFQLLRRHRYLRLIAVLLALATATLLCTDYLFKATAARNIAAGDLGAFFASYYAILNATALLFQFVLSAYVLKRLGILAAFTVLPMLLLAGGTSVLLLGGLFGIVLLTKAADGGLRHSLHRISSELLWMPLPEDVRSGSKSFVDTVVVRLTQAGVGGGIFLLAAQGWDTPRMLGGLIVGLALLWVAMTVWVRAPYLALFKTALQSGRGESALELDRGAVEVVVEALSSRDTARATAAIELLAGNDRARLIPALILYHESEGVLLAALRDVPSADRKDWQPLTERLLSHESGAVRIAAMRALANFGNDTVVEAGLHDINPEVRGHAAFLVAERSGEPPAAHDAVGEVLSMTGSSGLQAKLGLLRSIENRGNSSWAPVLLAVSRDASPALTQALARASIASPEPELLSFFVGQLTTRESRDAVRDALVALGTPALIELERLLKEPATAARLRTHLPRSISRFGSQLAVDILVRQLASEKTGLVRYKILRGLSRLAANSRFRFDPNILEEQLHRNLLEHLKMRAHHYFVESEAADSPATAQQSKHLLRDLLNDKVRQSWERVLRLLQILHPSDDLRGVARAAESSDKRVRAQALEYIDAMTLSSTLTANRQLLILVLDELSPAERVSRFRKFVPDLPAQIEPTLATLIADSDEALATIAAFHALSLDLRPLQKNIAEAAERHPRLQSLRARLSSNGLAAWEPIVAS